MFSDLFLDEAAVLPLRAIVFQCLLLLVAIAAEAIMLRQRMQLGFQPSIRYAAVLNILTCVVGWVAFLTLEPVLPQAVRTQIMSYVLFGHFYAANALSGSLEAIIVAAGLLAFFCTFVIKFKGLEVLTWLLGAPIAQPVQVTNGRRLTGRRATESTPPAPHMLAVLQANALSFTLVLLLLLLRDQIG